MNLPEKPNPVNAESRVSAGKPKKLLDHVREVMCLRRYSWRTEKSYTDWIKRFVKFHRMESRAGWLTRTR